MSPIRTQPPEIHSALAADPVLREMVEVFVAEMPVRLTRIQRHLADQAWEPLRRTVHQLKGAAGSYGFDALTPHAMRLETLLASSAPKEKIEAAVHLLVEHCRRVTAAPLR